MNRGNIQSIIVSLCIILALFGICWGTSAICLMIYDKVVGENLFTFNRCLAFGIILLFTLRFVDKVC